MRTRDIFITLILCLIGVTDVCMYKAGGPTVLAFAGAACLSSAILRTYLLAGRR